MKTVPNYGCPVLKNSELLTEKVTSIHMISLHYLKTVYMIMGFIAFQRSSDHGNLTFSAIHHLSFWKNGLFNNLFMVKWRESWAAIQANSARVVCGLFFFQEKAKPCYKETSRCAENHCVIHIILEMVSIWIVSRSDPMLFAESQVNYISFCFGINDICKPAK